MRAFPLAVSLSFLIATSAGCAGTPVAAQAPAGVAAQADQAPQKAPVASAVDLRLPNKKGTVKFAVIGDNGTGEKEQYDIGAEMAKWQTAFPFDFVIMLGDNMYGSQNPRDFVQKFEEPYKLLLERDVKFYAALGNHDNQENRFYKPWNMNGERFYAYEKGNVRFFVLDTDYLDQPQRQWIERQLQASNDDWKIVYFHHPLYSSARAHGSQTDLQLILEPIFVKHGVNVVFQGHDHVYERIKPQKGIYYFVEGSSGKLRPGDLRKTALTEVGNDREQTFMIVEVDDDELHFQAITRAGRTIDSGTLKQQEKPKPPPTATTGAKP
jgi:3',5'-cyclic AMP phosphodiesterase CpdA